jgi:hypothetical protein
MKYLVFVLIFLLSVTITLLLAGCGRGGVSVVNPKWIGGSQIFEPKDNK